MRQRRGQQTAKHVTAVERRNRKHVEDGEQDVHLDGRPPAAPRAGTETFGSPSVIGEIGNTAERQRSAESQEQVARRTGGRPPARNRACGWCELPSC